MPPSSMLTACRTSFSCLGLVIRGDSLANPCRHLASAARTTDRESAHQFPLPTPGTPPPSLAALLSDAGVLAALESHGIDSTTSSLATRASRVAVAAALTRATGVPLPSHAYARMKTAEDAAQWFAFKSTSLLPPMPGPHAVRLIAAGVGESDEGVEVAQRIAQAGGVVEEDLLESMTLPENLTLDPRTFRQVPKRTLGTAKPSWRRRRPIPGRNR